MLNAKSFNDVAIASAKWNDYKIYLLYMTKNETINIIEILTWLGKWNIFFTNRYKHG